MVNAKKWLGVGLLVVMVVALSAGCTKAPAKTPTPTPTQAPAKTSAPAKTEAPAKTSAPAKTEAPAAKPTAQAPSAKSESLDDFYAKSRVTLLVPQTAGGSTDYAARLYASFWTEVTGGSMIVKNNPGAGGIIGMEQIYLAKPDGLTIGYAHAGGLIIKGLFEDPRPKFEPTKYNWLGYMSDEPVFLVISGKKPYQNLQDLQKAKGLKCSAFGVIDTSSIFSGVAVELLGLDAKIVPGFGGATESSLALARGEIDFMIAWSSYLAGLLKPGDFKAPVVVMQRQRSPIYKDVPAITEVVKLTPEQDKYMTLADALFSGRAPLGPPGMDKAKVDFLRVKTKQIFALKPYIQQAKLQWKDWVAPLDGETMQKAVEKSASMDRAEAAAIVDKVVRSRLVMK